MKSPPLKSIGSGICLCPRGEETSSLTSEAKRSRVSLGTFLLLFLDGPLIHRPSLQSLPAADTTYCFSVQRTIYRHLVPKRPFLQRCRSPDLWKFPWRVLSPYSFLVLSLFKSPEPPFSLLRQAVFYLISVFFYCFWIFSSCLSESLSPFFFPAFLA